MSEARLEALQATDVFWDFVEVPSQFFENFCYDADVMKKIAVDSQGNPISDELLTKNAKRQKYLNSVFVMKQLLYGMLDLKIHVSLDWEKEEPSEGFSKIDNYLNKVLSPYQVDYGFKMKTIYRHFSHIFSSVYGYTCGYYSYFWADVI